METDREQIRKIADSISYECQQSKTCDGCFEMGRVCSDYKTAEKIYSAGYRKASDVIYEFKNRILNEANLKLVNLDGEHKAIVDLADVLKIAAEMRQEVEK